MESPINPEATFENFIIEKRANQDNYHYYVYSYRTINLDDGTDYHFLINTKEMIDMDGVNMLTSKLVWYGQCLYRVDEMTGQSKEILWCTGGNSDTGGGFSGYGTDGGNNYGDIITEEWQYYPNGNGSCTKIRTIKVPGAINNHWNLAESTSDSYITESFSNVECPHNGNNYSNDTDEGDPHFNDEPEAGEFGGGGSPQGSYPDTSIVATVLVIPYDVQIMECLGSYILTTGNTSIQNWLDKAMATNSNGLYINFDAYRNAKGLSSYLKDNCNAESEAFALLAIEAFESDGEVDFDDKIINELKGKEKCLHNLLSEKGDDYVKNIFKNFKGESEFNIKIISKDKVNVIDDDGNVIEVNGTTSAIINDLITINISTSKAESRSALDVARTILHEYIHADIRRKMKTISPSDSDKKFKDDFEQYGEDHHEAMGALYVNSMRDTMKDFHKNVLTDDYNKYTTYYEEGPSDAFYEALSWRGLKENDVKAWTDLPPETKIELESLSLRVDVLTKAVTCPD